MADVFFTVGGNPRRGGVPAGRKGLEPVPDAVSRVAVVDDDRAVLDALCFVLRLEGFAVDAFDNGDAFLAAVAETPPACVILDQGMEGLDGLAVAEKLRQRGSMLPLILISGTVTPRLRLLAAAAGVDTVLEKPLFGNGLALAVAQAVCLVEARG